jgi:hypothetical protein
MEKENEAENTAAASKHTQVALSKLFEVHVYAKIDGSAAKRTEDAHRAVGPLSSASARPPKGAAEWLLWEREATDGIHQAAGRGPI